MAPPPSRMDMASSARSVSQPGDRFGALRSEERSDDGGSDAVFPGGMFFRVPLCPTVTSLDQWLDLNA